MDILQAARQLRPGTAWVCEYQDGEYVNLRQADDGTPRVDVPTQDELQGVIDKVAYKDKRAFAYPPLPDQLDALWKYLNTLDQTKLPDDTRQMLSQIESVKTAFPKPQ